MTGKRTPFVIPILIIVVGVGWLLTVKGFGPGINWIWTLGLAVIGILTFVVSGIDKVSIVIGPFFLIASSLSVARQMGQLSLDVEVPILVIGIGVLLMFAMMKQIPIPAWYFPTEPSPDAAASLPKKVKLD